MHRSHNRIVQGLGGIYAASQSMDGLATYILFMVTLLIVGHVVGCLLFNAPLKGNIELIEVGMVLVVFPTMAYVTFMKGNVLVEVLTSHFPKYAQKILSSVMLFIGAGLFAIMTWQIGLSAQEALDRGLCTDVLEIPLFPFWVVMTIMAALTCLILLTYFIDSLSGGNKWKQW